MIEQKIEVVSNLNGIPKKISIDGQEIKNVSNVSVSAQPGQINTVTVEIQCPKPVFSTDNI